MSGFFKLPPEIRRNIYHDCLVVGRVFPYMFHRLSDNDDDSYYYTNYFNEPLPAAALLRTCRTIHSEAEPLLYQENTFVLSKPEAIDRFFDRSLHSDSRRAWISSVELVIAMLDITRGDREAKLDEQLELSRESMLFPESVPQPWLRNGVYDWDAHLHQAYKACLTATVWPRKVGLITKHLRLRELVIDFTYAVCLKMCCNLRKQALEDLRKLRVEELPKTLEVVYEHEDEDCVIRDDVQAAKELMAVWSSTRGMCKGIEKE